MLFTLYIWLWLLCIVHCLLAQLSLINLTVNLTLVETCDDHLRQSLVTITWRRRRPIEDVRTSCTLWQALMQFMAEFDRADPSRHRWRHRHCSPGCCAQVTTNQNGEESLMRLQPLHSTTIHTTHVVTTKSHCRSCWSCSWQLSFNDTKSS